jgi:predicted GNAT family N-acyltransferase
MFEALRVTEYWQRACVYYIRLDEFVHEFDMGVAHELDDRDTPETPYILVMDDHSKPVGTCRLRYLDAETGKIERVSVLKQYRGTGAGRVAIEAAEAWLKENGVKKIVINSRTTAVGFYEKLGYVTDWASKEEHGGPFGCVNTYKTLEA